MSSKPAMRGPRASSKKTRIETPVMVAYIASEKFRPRASSKKTRIETLIYEEHLVILVKSEGKFQENKD